MKGNFIERTFTSLIAASEYAASAERMASEGGLLQAIDPRVKVAGAFGLIIVVVASRNLGVIGALFAAAFLLLTFSHVKFARLAAWVWLPVLFFTGAIALPALFTTPGEPLAAAANIPITKQGLRTAAFLLSRAETAATLSALLVFSTPWPWVLKALRAFRCPVVLVAILGMTYRYIFVILQTAFEMFESRKSRTVGILEPADRRRIAASTVGVLLSKTIQLSGDVHLAMQSRGFRGEVFLLQDFHAQPADWCWAAGFAGLAACGLWFGR